MHRPLSLLLGSLLTVGCAAPLVRVPPPDAGLEPAAAPVLDEVIDLGGLPMPEQGLLSAEQTDERCTPGEWLALVGEHMHGGARVTVGDIAVPVAGYLQGGSLLVRVPLGLAPGKHQVRVETARGSAEARLACSIYTFGGDVQGDALRLRRLGPESGGFEEEALDIELEKARFQALSPDGALLYAIQKPVYDTPYVPDEVNLALKVAKRLQGGPVKCTLLVVHLGAKDAPQVAGRGEVTLSTKPTGMAVGPRGQLVVLQKRQLTVFDLGDPLRPREVATLVLADEDEERELIEACFLDDGTSLAVLEAYENRVHLIDLAVPERPRHLEGLRLANSADEPFSIDMTPAADGGSVWVLQGPNLRLAGKRLLDGLKALWGDVRRLEFAQAVDTVGATAKRVAMPPQEGLCRLVQVARGRDGLQVIQSIPLPQDLFPFFVQPDGKGSLYVSGINRTVLDLSRLELSFDGLLNLLEMLKDAAQLGRVLQVSERDGRYVTALQGLAIYYDLALLPRGELLASVVRLGPGYLPPRVTLDWGLEVAHGPFAKLREVANSTTALSDALKKLMPPYDYERIGVQR